VDGQPLTYDANGNLASYNGWTYTYDAQNRLISAVSTGNPQLSTTVAYDARNRRVSRTVNGASSFLFYQGWDLSVEGHASATDTSRYIHGSSVDELLTLTRHGSVLNESYYYHHDSLGLVTHLTDSAATVTEKCAYAGFGHVAISDPLGSKRAVSAVGNRFLYTGREMLSELQLYDYRNRIYCAETGRFLQPDPLRFGSSDQHLYRYTRNNPANLTDAFGLEGVTLEAGIVCNSQCIVEATGCDAFPVALQGACYAHEAVHIGQLSSSFCRKNSRGCCKDANKVPLAPRDYNGKPDWPDLECPAHAAELAYLRTVVPPDDTARMHIEHRIGEILDTMQAHSCP
jgi:RHS repeat-associated protein